jgi:hypothetical protein
VTSGNGKRSTVDICSPQCAEGRAIDQGQNMEGLCPLGDWDPIVEVTQK